MHVAPLFIRQVLECGSPLPLSTAREGARAPKPGRNASSYRKLKIAALIAPNPPASFENLERFRHLVLANSALLDRLRATTELADFAALTVQLGREHGCHFSAEDVRSAVRERRRAWLAREM